MWRARARTRVAAAAAVAHMLAVSWLSSRGQGQLPDGPWSASDKLTHASVWAVLGVSLALAARRPRWRTALIAIVIATGFGALDEIHQSFVPGRDASVFDLLADAVGATVGALAVTWYSRRRCRAPSSMPSAVTTPASPPTSSSPITSR